MTIDEENIKQLETKVSDCCTELINSLDEVKKEEDSGKPGNENNIENKRHKVYKQLIYCITELTKLKRILK